MPSKKYKLFAADIASSAAATGDKPICAFFNSSAGCRNGDSCAFRHSTNSSSSSGGGGAVAAAADRKRKNSVEISEASSVVSSESGSSVRGSGKNTAKPIVKTENGVTPMSDQFNVEVVDMDDPFETSAPFEKQQQEKQEQQQQPKKKKKRKSTNSEQRDLFATPKNCAPTGATTSKQPQQNQTPQKRQKKTPDGATGDSKGEGNSNSSNFQRLLSNLPVASFSIPGVTPVNPTTPPTSTSAVSADASSKNEKPQKAEKPKAQRMLPTSTEVGRKWKNVVLKTQQHEKFDSSYDFTRYKENDKEAGIPTTWIKAKPFGAWCQSNPQAIAIDCEMCETQDPLSGSKNHRALCRLSVVNAEKPDEVLLDTLVKPSWPVTNYRTWINGITKESLDKVEFTVRHAQAFMMALCSEETVIVGHAVQNDLAAMNMEHEVVADSSFLFHAKDSTTATVSLKDAVKSVMGLDMPETHDSVNDARKALECVLHWREKDGQVELVERTPKNHPFQHQRTAHQLFVHRIPKVCKAEHLSKMFQKNTSIEPTAVDEVVFAGETGKAHVSFKSARHANLAFDSLDGNADEDKSGRLQKKVYLRNGDYVRVRKMLHAKRPPTPSSSASTP